MYPSHFYITFRLDYKTTIKEIAQKAFLDLCKQIFSKGRSQTIRQFFEQEYKVSFPIEIICCYYDKMICERDKDLVEKIHGSLSKKIEDLEDDSYDFLLMSNLCRRVLWRKKKKKKEGLGKPEEEEVRIIKKLMRLMKKLVYEINLIHYEDLLCDEKFYSQKFTRSMLLDKINSFQTLLGDTLEEAQFSIMYSETSVRDLKEQLKAKVDALFKRIIDKEFDASNPSDIARFKEEELKDFDTLRWRAIMHVREEIIKSRNVWLAQNGVYYTVHSDYVPLNLEFDKNFHNVWDKDNNCKDCRLINQYQLLNVKFGDETRNNLSSVIVVNGDAGVEKTIMLLDLVNIFDDEKDRIYTETSSDAAGEEKFYSATPLIEKAARQEEAQQNIIDRLYNRTEEISAAEKIRDDIRRLGRYIRRFDILLYIPMKNGKFEKFEDYLKSLIPQTLEKALINSVMPPPGLGLPLDGSYDLGQVLDALSQSKCLILCDGYDEANDKSRKLFDELLRFNFQQECRFIVTTRRNNETPKLIKIIDDTRISRIVLNVTT